MKKLIAIAVSAAMILAGCETTEKLPASGNASFVGTMSVVFQGAEVPSENVMIDVVYEEDGTLALMFNKVKFVPQMPMSLDVKVSGITYIDKNGVVTFSGNGIVPTYGLVNTEMPDYTVTKLSGSISDNTLKFSLNFGAIPTSYTGARQLPE